MKYHTLNGVIGVDGKEFQSEFSTMIHKSGYFYVRSEDQPNLQQIRIYIRPFTSDMFSRNTIDRKNPLVLELRGNCIGHVAVGSGNAEGTWRTWYLNKVVIDITQFADGVSMKFEIGTDRGALTWHGGIDENTIGTLDPFNYRFKVFVPIGILKEFLCGEYEEWLAPDYGPKIFIDFLNESGFKNHTD